VTARASRRLTPEDLAELSSLEAPHKAATEAPLHHGFVNGTRSSWRTLLKLHEDLWRGTASAGGILRRGDSFDQPSAQHGHGQTTSWSTAAVHPAGEARLPTRHRSLAGQRSSEYQPDAPRPEPTCDGVPPSRTEPSCTSSSSGAPSSTSQDNDESVEVSGTTALLHHVSVWPSPI
jgi:hypothetical protein